MKSRVRGVQKFKAHLYKDMCLVGKDAFYQWALESGEFHKLFEDYENNNYERKLSPSVDRIDPSKGYSFNNMEFVTMSENSRRSSVTRNRCPLRAEDA